MADNTDDIKRQVAALIELMRAVADAIRDLTIVNGGVPSGELYAHLTAAGIDLELYNGILDRLIHAGLVERKNHYLRWIGPT